MDADQQTLSVADSGPVRDEPPLLASGSLFASRYEIHGMLGRGGFGLVYRAFDRTLRREVALKVLRADRDSPSSLQRFRREAALARDAESPNLLRIFDLGAMDGGRPFLVMELVSGGSLRERLARGPLSADEARQLGIDLLRGLAALHARGVVHRDVKPSNLLFAADGRYKLGDLGLARSIVSDETQLTIGDAPVGTLDYLAPEQVLGHDADARSDLYAAGLVLLEALTGRPVFPAHGSLATLLLRVQQRPPDPRRADPRPPRWLAQVLRRLLERDPRRRYATAEAALADLQHRHGPRGFRWPRRTLLRAGMIPLAIAVAVAVAVRALDQHELKFDHLEPLGVARDAGARAVDRSGRVLWSIPDIQANTSYLSAVARLRAGQPERLVAILRKSQSFAPEENSRLSVLDTETGEVVETIDLRPRDGRPFHGFADRYWPGRVAAVDLDGDDLDEVIVSFDHGPSWPSYTVLWEPSARRSRVVLVATGHHHFTRAADLDGDGRPELLFNGINSTLGHYNAVAAVRLEPWIGERPENWGISWYAFTPGYTGHPPGDRMAGYRLLPLGDLILSDAGVRLDQTTRALRLLYNDRAPFTLGFDAWLAPQGSERGRAERSAWADIAEAMRLSEIESWANAAATAAHGIDEAKLAGEDLLAEAAGRIHAKALIGEGKLADGEAAFARLVQRTDFSSEIAFDAALSLHLSGQLDRAISWYERGLDLGGADRGGKNRYFFLEGIVFARVEQRQWLEAELAVDRFVAAFPQLENWAELLRSWIFTRSGRRPPFVVPLTRSWSTDAQRYLDLERAWGAGAEAESLLTTIDRELAEPSSCRGALLSLKGAVLTRVGRSGEARGALEEAISLLASGARRSSLNRVALPQALERAAAAGVPLPGDRGTDLAQKHR